MTKLLKNIIVVCAVVSANTGVMSGVEGLKITRMENKEHFSGGSFGGSFGGNIRDANVSSVNPFRPQQWINKESHEVLKQLNAENEGQSTTQRDAKNVLSINNALMPPSDFNAKEEKARIQTQLAEYDGFGLQKKQV